MTSARSDSAAQRRQRVLRQAERLAPDLLRFTKDLVRAKSVTGEEEPAQLLVREKLRSLGAKVDFWKPKRGDFRGYEAFVSEESNVGKRPNVVGRFRGRGDAARTLAFNGHIDVVPEGDPSSWKHPPYAARVVDGKLYGRGACDMKGGLAGTIFAVEALLGAGVTLQNEIIVESVIGEESGGMGTLAAIQRGYVPDAAVIAEPTGLALNVVQAGCLMFRLGVRGKAAHGAARYMGVSAVEKFVPVMAALQKLENRRKSMKRLSAFRGVRNPVTLSIGTVRAGVWDSTVPEELTAEGRYGVWPHESLDNAKRAFEAAVQEATAADPWLRANPPSVSWFGPQWESAEIGRRHWLTRLMSRAVEDSLGFAPNVSGITGGTDMRLFTGIAGKPAIIFGPGDDSTAHFRDECIEVKDVVRACKAYSLAALAWNG
ncbi:MAG: ArgE/DapE family deacylase [Nitrososphaerota archaeon]|nr:ArgE/DapE family deacylase [Nitrososphaerota archaeon]